MKLLQQLHQLDGYCTIVEFDGLDRAVVVQHFPGENCRRIYIRRYESGYPDYEPVMFEIGDKASYMLFQALMLSLFGTQDYVGIEPADGPNNTLFDQDGHFTTAGLAWLKEARALFKPFMDGTE